MGRTEARRHKDSQHQEGEKSAGQRQGIGAPSDKQQTGPIQSQIHGGNCRHSSAIQTSTQAVPHQSFVNAQVQTPEVFSQGQRPDDENEKGADLPEREMMSAGLWNSQPISGGSPITIATIPPSREIRFREVIALVSIFDNIGDQT